MRSRALRHLQDGEHRARRVLEHGEPAVLGEGPVPPQPARRPTSSRTARCRTPARRPGRRSRRRSRLSEPGSLSTFTPVFRPPCHSPKALPWRSSATTMRPIGPRSIGWTMRCLGLAKPRRAGVDVGRGEPCRPGHRLLGGHLRPHAGRVRTAQLRDVVAAQLLAAAAVGPAEQLAVQRLRPLPVGGAVVDPAGGAGGPVRVAGGRLSSSGARTADAGTRSCRRQRTPSASGAPVRTRSRRRRRGGSATASTTSSAARCSTVACHTSPRE
jgi:hypothetical protein